ncbi:MAG: hypothetical protein EA387_11055 [Nitriliruptor sp.]|nr:MAG: hypothetical protein EA387_11055 [Nitriliruptor sp.]
MPAAAGTDHTITGELETRVATGATGLPRSTEVVGVASDAGEAVTAAGHDATGRFRWHRERRRTPHGQHRRADLGTPGGGGVVSPRRSAGSPRRPRAAAGSRGR